MGTITPMGRLKDLMNTFKETIGREIIKKDDTLNESKPKYNPYGYGHWEGSWSKGVKNEFLRIFKTSEKESFAFIFNNTKEELDKVLISVSIKNEEEYISRTMSFEEFKASLKECIRTVKLLKDVGKLDTESLYMTLNNVFKIDKKVSVEKTVQKIVNNLKEETKEIKAEIKTAKTNKTKTMNKLGKIIEKGDQEMEAFDKSIDFKTKEKEFLQAEKVFKAAKKKFEDTKKLQKKKRLEVDASLGRREAEKAYEDAMLKLSRLDYNLRDKVNKFTKPYDKKIKEMVTEKIL